MKKYVQEATDINAWLLTSGQFNFTSEPISVEKLIVIKLLKIFGCNMIKC